MEWKPWVFSANKVKNGLKALGKNLRGNPEIPNLNPT